MLTDTSEMGPWPQGISSSGKPRDEGVRRLVDLENLGGDAAAVLIAAARRAVEHPARREFLADGRSIVDPLMVVEGWAARLRILADGRRQILGLYLPGDVIGDPLSPIPSRASSTLALTKLRLCRLPLATRSLEVAYGGAIARAGEYLLAQIARLGSMTAHERIVDLLLELMSRLKFTGSVRSGGFSLPLTQELLADTLGLTPVHINRTIQQLRRSGAVRWSGGYVELADPGELAKSIGRPAV